MRKLKIRHQSLQGVGELFELRTAAGMSITVISHGGSGRRDVAIGLPDADEPMATATLTRREAAAVAALVTGAHIELTTRPT